MAEIGLLASIVQVADIGLRLSLRLYAFGETVASADRSISAISNDVSLTSSVLKELGDLLKSDTSRIYSDNAVKTADAVVRECSKAFTEMDEMLLKKVPQLHSGDVAKQSRASLILERLRWPAIKGKIELLRVNLDRMKSTLTLMLNVIMYAKQVSERKESPSVLSDQRQLIDDLAKANQDREREFNELRLALEGTHISQKRPVATPKASPAFEISLFALPQMKSHGAETAAGQKDQHTTSTDSSASGFPPTTEPAVRLLLAEYTKLHSRLLTEVRSPHYKIEDESRARYTSDISSRYNQEIQLACGSKQKIREFDDQEDTDPAKVHQEMIEAYSYSPVIPSEIQAPIQVPDEKRKRNATASHRFRQRRKEREQQAANNIARLEQQAKNMAHQRDSYRRERDALQNALIRRGASLSMSNTSHDQLCEEPQSEGAGLDSTPATECHESVGAEYEGSNDDRGYANHKFETEKERRRNESDLSSILDEFSLSQAGDEKAVIISRQCCRGFPASSKPESYNPERYEAETAKQAPFVSAESRGDTNVSSDGDSTSYQAESQIRRSFDGQIASQWDLGAFCTLEGSRTSNDTITVDNLISRWTNFEPNSPKHSLLVYSRQSS